MQEEETFILPAELRKALSAYIQMTPCPNEPVKIPLALIMGLQNLTSMKKTKGVTPTLVPDLEDENGESWVIPGGVEESTEEDKDNG